MIVHNTDSVFFTFNLKDGKTGEPVTGQKALEVTIEMAKEAGEVATKFLKSLMIWNMKKHSFRFAYYQKRDMLECCMRKILTNVSGSPWALC